MHVYCINTAKMHQSNVFFYKNIICQNYFLFIKKNRKGISTFHSNGTGAPKQAQCITRERAATSRSLRFWVSTIRIWEDHMLWCWNLYIWSFLDDLFFRHDFRFHISSFQLTYWNLKWNLPSLVSEVEKTTKTSAVKICEVRPGELHHRWHLLKLHCFNHQNEKKSNNLLVRDISWFTGAC